MVRSLPLLLMLLRAGSASADDDPLLAILSQDDEPGRRDAIEAILRARGADGCGTLSAYARARDPRARENAVRAMGRRKCSLIDDYRPFFSDGSAWVTDALLDALMLNGVAEGVPYALARLGDRRRLVSDGGSWTVSESAQRMLRTLTGQPIRSRVAPGSEGDAGATEAAWRAWFAEHGNEPAAAWIESGMQVMREALTGVSAVRRLDALETAALIGEPGRALLAAALRRGASDLEASLSCAPDEPPRVTDLLPCVLSVKNSTSRRVALAAGEVGVEVTSRESAPSGSRDQGKSVGRAAERSPRKESTEARGPKPPVGRPAFEARILSGRMVDLAPGESLRRQVQIGPVGTAGRYELKARLTDLWESLNPGQQESFPIEATLVMRFEQ